MHDEGSQKPAVAAAAGGSRSAALRRARLYSTLAVRALLSWPPRPAGSATRACPGGQLLHQRADLITQGAQVVQQSCLRGAAGSRDPSEPSHKASASGEHGCGQRPLQPWVGGTFLRGTGGTDGDALVFDAL